MKKQRSRDVRKLYLARAATTNYEELSSVEPRFREDTNSKRMAVA